MSEPKLISPMLDNFAMGDPINEHHGVRCCPAIERNSDGKYIVKIISIPATQRQLDALLLSGAFADTESATIYFKDLADNIIQELEALKALSALRGFIAYDDYQIVPMDDGVGFDVYILGSYKTTLQRYLRKNPMTHLSALNLGLDLCSALSICRNNGYLYADLKPDNIFITDDKEFKIGDLGFLRLDSLKYISLPDRYHSIYTAPEITDAFSALNATIDVYAVGMILYQVFNDGVLPTRNENESVVFPSPAYADYELAEIILKACAFDPSSRWETPEEMGQALINYMQRNGAHDTPITPVVAQQESVAPESSIEPSAAEAATESNEPSENMDQATTTGDAVFEEDSEGNLTFINNFNSDETSLDQHPEEIEYHEVTEEVSDMLTQADELIQHPTPDPVVQPEPIDVPVPPIVISEESNSMDDNELGMAEDSAAEIDAKNYETNSDNDELEENDKANNVEYQPHPCRWVAGLVVGICGLILIAAGLLFYKFYYIQPIESMVLEQSDIGSVTVFVSSPIDEEKLTVICSDTYGNQLLAPVKNGQATIKGLAPNSAYSVKVVIDGFHRLTGEVSTSFTTPAQSNIVQFQVVTGAEEGTAIVSFTLDGPDSNNWIVRYAADGEDEKEVTFSGRMTEIKGLTVGATYTFTLTPEDDLHIIGITEVVHTANKIVRAEDLSITACSNNQLTVSWWAPNGVTVESWTARCYNNNGYDKTITVNEPSAVFDDIDSAQSYTIEVTASGMSVHERTFAAANSISVKNFAADQSEPNMIRLSWESNVAQNNWILSYTVDNTFTQEISCASTNTALIIPRIPGATYRFTLKTADGITVIGGFLKVTTDPAKNFEGYSVKAEHMEFKMCKTPSKTNWDRNDLKNSDYTTQFKIGQQASFLIRMHHTYSTSKDSILTLFVIRDENGKIVCTSTSSAKWISMWSKNYCELDIPKMPPETGTYTISVYFNGAIATTQSFTII